jgi:hypothetical protein
MRKERASAPGDDELRAWLRSGDPVSDGREPGPAEVAWLRQAVREAAASRVPGPRWEPVAAAAGALAAALLVVSLLGDRLSRAPSAPDGAAASPRPSPSEEAGAQRQVQFTTQRGTRVLWTLDAEFEL